MLLIPDQVGLQLFDDLEALCPTVSNVNRAGFSSPDTGDIPKAVEHDLRLETRIDGAVIGVRLRELPR